MNRYLAGLEPERLTETTLKFHRGSVANIAGTVVYDVPTLVVDTAAEGPLGMAYCGFNIGVDYFPYVIRNKVTGNISITLSNQISTSLVVLPSTDWEIVRKLPWGFVGLNEAYVPDGVPGACQIPTFHISYWPKPFTLLTQATTESNFCKVLSNGNSAELVKFSLKKLMPDNARVANLLLVVTGSGDAFLSAGSHQAGGIRIRPGQVVMDIRVISDTTLYYKVTGTAVLNAYILGYSSTEPS